MNTSPSRPFQPFKPFSVPPHALGPLHFIGIGGIGMSGIAEILHHMGYEVQGSDLVVNQNVERLKHQGIQTFEGHAPHHLGTATVVIISSDVRSENIELIEARRRRLPIVLRAEMLAELMRLRPSIAIAGTHGKTTTTSLGAAVLERGGFDPTVVSGGIINAYGTNARLGQGDWIIVEADESDGSFTKLPATIAVVTNIDPEHMDHYGSLENLHQAFAQFISHIPFYGLGIVCGDHPIIKKLRTQWGDRRILTYGFGQDCDLRAFNLKVSEISSQNEVQERTLSTDSSFSSESGVYQRRQEGTFGGSFSGLNKTMTFDISLSEAVFQLCKSVDFGPVVSDVRMPLLGEHNALNALAIFGVGLELGMSEEDLKKGIQHFSGVRRRFTLTGQGAGITVVDDYAHHPVEIEAVLKTARLACPPGRRVIAVLQPHRYSRLRTLFDEFTQCVQEADCVIVCPIYGAREDPIPGLTHGTLVQALRNKGKEVMAVENEQELASLVYRIANPGDYVICMGAGTITHWAYRLPKALAEVQTSLVQDLAHQAKRREA